MDNDSAHALCSSDEGARRRRPGTDGVCGLFIAEKLGLSAPTASGHLGVITQAGLQQAKRPGKWTFYKRNERRIREIKQACRRDW